MWTVLLVERDKALSQKFTSLMKDRGVNTDLCNRVGSAIERLRFFTYDALVVDFGSKGLKPAEVIPILKKISPRVPIIALTEKTESFLEEEIQKAGVFTCLLKPVKDGVFTDAIDRAVQKKETVH